MDSVDVGSIIASRYRIEERLGKGGFGAVFAAQHLGTQQKVAIKFIGASHENDPIALQRFFREAHVTSGLRHPNTVRVFDFGEDNGQLFLAMEYLTGCTLGQEMKKRALLNQAFTEAEAIHIGVEITRSLSEAHAHTLVHRDLAPNNIFLLDVQGDERRSVKVLDFGIVKCSGVPLTSPLVRMGTPSFTSPDGDGESELDARSDVYSLGILLFWMVAGETPFGQRPLLELLRAHAMEPTPDVSTRALSPVSARFALLIARATAKRKEDRFQSAAEMRAALVACQTAAALQREETRTELRADATLITTPKLPTSRAGAIRAFAIGLGLGIGVMVGVNAAKAPVETPAPVIAVIEAPPPAPAPAALPAPLPERVEEPKPEPEPLKKLPKRPKTRASALKEKI